MYRLYHQKHKTKPLLNQGEASELLCRICRSYKVPSGYFLIDVVMMLDQEFFAEKLLVGHEQKLHLAAHEGVKLKKLVGAVRALWRSSPSANHPKVNQLKSLLRKSPSQSTDKEFVSWIYHLSCDPFHHGVLLSTKRETM